MTTTTDWDVRDVETGEHPIVTDVTSAATDAAPVYTGEEAIAVRKLNAQLTDQMRRLDAENVRLSAAYEQARVDLEALRAELHPLDARRTGWTPGPRAMPARHWTDVHGVDDLTEQQQRAALVAPTLPELRDGDGEHYLGAVVAAELTSGVDHPSGWPTWLGQLHFHQSRSAEIDAEFRAIIDRNTRDADSTVWDDELRALCEPVATDWWEREDRLMVGLVTREQQSVYDELAPERIQANESETPKPITPAAEMKGSVNPDPSEQALVPTGAPERHDPPQRDDEPDDRVQRMAEGRRRRDTLAARSSDDEPTSEVGGSDRTSKSKPPRVGGWRTWAKSIGLGAVLFGAMIAAVVVLA